MRNPGMVKATLVGGQQIVAHNPKLCEGRHCAIHNPSDHPMKDWPQLWRDDRRLMERICPEHGVGHPDPDHLAFLRKVSPDHAEAEAVHGCCGCCVYPTPVVPRSFQVPVWFNVEASSSDEAWQKIQSYVDALIRQIPALIFTKNLVPTYEFTVEEPIENEEFIPEAPFTLSPEI